MSGNEKSVKLNHSLSGRKLDARVRRTRDALGDALVRLMLEKSFDAITIQEVLDRAGVARSTFYSHFSDKDDLLLSDADEFFEGVAMSLSLHGEASDRVFPVKEFFDHVGEMREFITALVRSGKFQENMDLARGHFARGIARRLAELPRAKLMADSDRSAIAFAQAGLLLSLLTWWIDHGMKESPRRMDELFHQMVWSGVSGG
jgi:AcrR family transcriptional regulator